MHFRASTANLIKQKHKKESVVLKTCHLKILSQRSNIKKRMKQRRSKRTYMTPLTKKFIASTYLTLLLHRTMQNNWEKTPNFWLLSQSVSSVAQLCLILCDPMNCSMPGLPVHHQLPESTQTHVHWVSDAIQPSHPLLSLLLLPSIFPSIRVFSNESVLHTRWPKYWSFSFNISPSNEHPGQISFRMD